MAAVTRAASLRAAEPCSASASYLAEEYVRASTSTASACAGSHRARISRTARGWAVWIKLLVAASQFNANRTPYRFRSKTRYNVACTAQLTGHTR